MSWMAKFDIFMAVLMAIAMVDAGLDRERLQGGLFATVCIFWIVMLHIDRRVEDDVRDRQR